MASPPPRSVSRGPDWRAIAAVAHRQGGYFSASDARAARISTALLSQAARAGSVEHPARGIYRLPDFPPHPQGELIMRWLWSDREGVYSHETALLLHRLSDVNPNLVVMTVPFAWSKRRVRTPAGLELRVATLPERDVEWIDAVPATTALRTVIDCERGDVDPELVQTAEREGLARGLFSRTQLTHARRAMRGLAG